MFKIKIVYKFLLIVFLFLGISILTYSGFKFANGDYTEFFMSLHKICGFSIAVIAVLHIIIKRRKLVKLANEFLDVILKRKNPSYCNMDRLIMALEDHTISSVASILNLDADELVEILRKGEVRLNSKEQTLRQIAKLNDEKIFYALVLIIERKFVGKSLDLKSCNI
ncbi:chemotaxis protein [Campylobacter sp. RM16190]|uniref:chemotaxis protein n=1 Tax=Campylobacter sp. RM16190 TaxID=1705727 RepID=UPI001473BDCA|nr:chemotaxis protein [Campylobacter sp. RM16190]